jgi:hypothetical protein
MILDSGFIEVDGKRGPLWTLKYLQIQISVVCSCGHSSPLFQIPFSGSIQAAADILQVKGHHGSKAGGWKSGGGPSAKETNIAHWKRLFQGKGLRSIVRAYALAEAGVCGGFVATTQHDLLSGHMTTAIKSALYLKNVMQAQAASSCLIKNLPMTHAQYLRLAMFVHGYAFHVLYLPPPATPSPPSVLYFQATTPLPFGDAQCSVQ